MHAAAVAHLQCDQLVAEGAVAASTPAEVVQQCDITFAMLADPDAALKVSSAQLFVSLTQV